MIDAQGLIKSALLVTRLARGRKHGYDRHSIREPLASFFYDEKHAVSKTQHAVERIRQLFALSLGYEKPQTQGDYAIAAHFLNNRAVSPDAVPYLVCLHATTRDTKHWPESHWRALFASWLILICMSACRGVHRMNRNGHCVWRKDSPMCMYYRNYRWRMWRQKLPVRKG